MTVLASVAAVVAVLALGVAIGFAVDSDDVDVSTAAVPDESGDSGEESDVDEFDDLDDFDNFGGPGGIGGFGELLSCAQESGLGLEDLGGLDMDFGFFLEECLGGLLGDGFLGEELFGEGLPGAPGGFDEFFEEFQGGDFGDLFEDFEPGDLRDFFGDLFEESSDTGA